MVIVLVLMAGGGIGLVSIDALYRSNVSAIAERSVLDAEAQFAAAQAAETDKMLALLDVLAFDVELRELMAERDREGLLEAARLRYQVLADRHGVTHWYVYEERGSDVVVFLRAYRGEEALDPALHGDVTQSAPVHIARDTGQPASGFVMGQTRLSLRAVVPWRDADGDLLGYLSLGQAVTGLLDGISGQTGDGYTMFLDKEQVDRAAWASSRAEAGLEDDWDDRESTLLVASTFEEDSLLEQLDPGAAVDEPVTLGVKTRGSATYVEGLFPLRDIEGTSVGAVLVLHDITDLHGRMRFGQMALLLSVLVVALVGAAVVSLALDRLIFGRLDRAVAHIEKAALAVAGGSQPAAAGLRSGSADDEIGRFERFLAQFLEVIAVALSRVRDNEEPAVRDSQGSQCDERRSLGEAPED